MKKTNRTGGSGNDAECPGPSYGIAKTIYDYLEDGLRCRNAADRTPSECIPDVLYVLCGLFWLGLDRVPVCKPLFQGTVGTAN